MKEQGKGFEHSPLQEMAKAFDEYKGAFSFALSKLAAPIFPTGGDTFTTLRELKDNKRGIVIHIKDKIFIDDILTMDIPSSINSHIVGHLSKEAEVKNVFFHPDSAYVETHDPLNKNGKGSNISFRFERGESELEQEGGNTRKPLTPAIIREFAGLVKEYDADRTEIIIYPIVDMKWLMWLSGF